MDGEAGPPLAGLPGRLLHAADGRTIAPLQPLGGTIDDALARRTRGRFVVTNRRILALPQKVEHWSMTTLCAKLTPLNVRC